MAQVVWLIAACQSPLRLPEPVTNQAVALLIKDGKPCIYTFYGLDSTKRWSGVHNKVMRVNLTDGSASSIGQVPDIGRLASSASVIGNKAYVVGGYAVFENGKEKSSNHLFIFDPVTEQFNVGASLPIPIDDHVQGVWREKLLYVVSGWTDSLNTNAVQVYDPVLDYWDLATPLPDEPGAKVFGGSGTLVGDTIYLLGGARFEKFYPPSRSFYKGAIDPVNPKKITWYRGPDYPGSFRYRSGTYLNGPVIVFFGGSNETYNYNGISYENKTPVEANSTSLEYSISRGNFTERPSSPVMDLRNMVVTHSGKVFVAGGMNGQRVLDAIESVNP